MWRRVRWVLRWMRRLATFAFVVLLLAIGFVAIAIHTEWGRDKQRAYIESALQDVFPGGATIRKLEGTAFGELVLLDVELDGRDHKPMIKIGKITLSISMSQLLSKTIRVDRVEVEGVEIVIRHQPPKPPEPEAPPSSGGGIGWAVELPRIEVNDAHVRVRDRDIPIDVDAIHLDGSLVLSKAGEISARASLRGEWRDRPVLASMIATYSDGELLVPLATVSGMDALVTALDVRVADDDLAGVVTIKAPVATVREIVPVTLPGDVEIVVAGDRDRVSVDGHVGETRVYAAAQLDGLTRTASFIASATSDDLSVPSYGRVTGHGTVAIAGEASVDRVRGLVGVLGAVVDPADSELIVAIDATRARAMVNFTGRREYNARVTGFGEVVLDNKTNEYNLARGRVTAQGHDMEDARGTLWVDATAHGPLTPVPVLAIEASVDGERLVYAGSSLGELHAQITGSTTVPDHSKGHATVVAMNFRTAGALVPSTRVDTDVAIARDGTVTLDITNHTIRSLVGTWAGRGGHVVISPERIAATGVRTGTAGSSITVTTASFSPVTKNVTAKIDAKHVDVAAIAPGAHGIVDGTLDIRRDGGAWSGSVHATGTGVGTAERGFDGHADVTITGRRVTLAAVATNPRLGDATVTAELLGPREILDVPAWMRLDRTAIVRAEIDLPRVDLVEAHATGAGKGHVSIVKGQIHGDLHATGVEIDIGRDTPITTNVDVSIGPGAGDEIAATVTANLPANITPTALARIAIPMRVFDPVSWQTLDRRALRGAIVRLEDTLLDQAALIALGVDVPYTGRVTATINLGEGGRGALVDAELTQVRGGPVLRPLTVRVTGGIDATGSHANVEVLDGTTQLVVADATSPLTPDFAFARLYLQAPLTGTVTVPKLDAAALLAIVGRTDVQRGTVEAAVKLGGFIGRPKGTATVTGRDIVVTPPIVGRDAPTLKTFDATATWDGATADLVVDGTEARGGTLHAKVHGRPDLPATSFDGEMLASNFDVAPLAVFAPGALSASGGTITEARLTYDPAAQRFKGYADVINASVPLTEMIGTLREARIHAGVDGGAMDVTGYGKLGAGSVTLTSTITLERAIPKHVDAKLTLAHVSPIGVLQPVLDANVHAVLDRDPKSGKWDGDIAVEDGVMNLSLAKEDKLYVAGAPADMVFVDAPPKVVVDKNIHVARREEAWLDVRIRIAPAEVHASDPRVKSLVGEVFGVIEGRLEVLLSDDGIGVQGQIYADRGNVDIVNRRYDVELAELDFDGPIYPKANVQVSHSFPDLTLTVSINGRLPSDIELHPHSDGGSYSEDQLFGFMFGGDPGGDPANAARDTATAAATAAAVGAVSGYITTRLNRQLPKALQIDIVRYTSASATSGSALELGKWVNRSLYLAYKRHLEELPNQNNNEGELEYYFTKPVLLDATVGDREFNSADLLYRLRW